MKITKLLVVIFTYLGASPILGQDCYSPPSGSVFYSTDAARYNLPVVTGLLTFDSLISGDWTILNTTGSVNARFSDNSGRTSTLELSGTGTVTVENIQTDLSVSTSTSTQCVQTFSVVEYRPIVVSNPNLKTLCPISVVVVLDESGSISRSGLGQSIREGVMVFGNLLSNSGSTMAIVEYDSRASRVAINGSTELQLVDPVFLEGLDSYLESGYNPVTNQSQLIGGTNWQDALLKAHSVADADLIMMLSMGSIAGEGEMFDLTALKYAQDVANQIKRSGKHLFVIGVDIPNSPQSLRDITGPDQYVINPTDLNSFLSADYISVSADRIGAIFAEVGISTCGAVVPTLGEWAVIQLFLVILILGVVVLREKSHRGPLVE